MARYYGQVWGQASRPATRIGTPNSGLVTICASWQGAVRCRVGHDENDRDIVTVSLTPWEGRGVERELYHGPIGE